MRFVPDGDVNGKWDAARLRQVLSDLVGNALEHGDRGAIEIHEAGFRERLQTKQRKGRVVRSAHFGFKERRFGGGLRPDSDAALVFFKRFQRSKLIFIAAVDLGYRISDLRLLKRKALDFRRGVASIDTGKTDRPARVALSDRCREALEAATHDVPNVEFVFTTDSGQSYSESTLRDYFAIAKSIAGITRRFRFGDMRHTFASNMASENISLQIIQAALGHTTSRMTERYSKPGDQAMEEMRNAMNRRQSRINGDTQRDTQAQK